MTPKRFVVVSSLACVASLAAWAVQRDAAEIASKPTEPASAPGTHTGDACPPVVLYDTHGSSDESTWTEIDTLGYQPANVRDLVLDNGLTRVTYEFLNDNQQGSHSVYLRHEGNLTRLTSPWYGDYTYWVSTIVEPAISAEASRVGDDLIEITYAFDHAPTAPWVDSVSLTKRVALARCQPGMFVKFEGDPINVPGEREFGIGRATPINFSEASLGVHPIAQRHVNMGLMTTEPGQPAWAAGLDPDGFMRVLALVRPMITLSYQFDPAHQGRVVVNQFEEAATEGDYQAFLGGRPFDTEGMFVEGESAGGYVFSDTDASDGEYQWLPFGNATEFSFSVAEDGVYALWLRARSAVTPEIELTLDGESWTVMNGLSEAFWPNRLGDVTLTAGTHTLRVHALSANLDLDYLAVVPNGLARDLALDAAPVFANACGSVGATLPSPLGCHAKCPKICADEGCATYTCTSTVCTCQ